MIQHLGPLGVEETTAELQVNDVVVFAEGHPWHGCVAVVWEVAHWGAKVEVRDPRGGSYPIRVLTREIIKIGRLP